MKKRQHVAKTRKSGISLLNVTKNIKAVRTKLLVPSDCTKFGAPPVLPPPSLFLFFLLSLSVCRWWIPFQCFLVLFIYYYYCYEYKTRIQKKFGIWGSFPKICGPLIIMLMSIRSWRRYFECSSNVIAVISTPKIRNCEDRIYKL